MSTKNRELSAFQIREESKSDREQGEKKKKTQDHRN